jgi:hypothetical protein
MGFREGTVSKLKTENFYTQKVQRKHALLGAIANTSVEMQTWRQKI